MQALIIQVATQTATFRIPEFQNFHKSFPLPPPTTLVGFAGAALGLSPKAAQEFFEGAGFLLGVYGTSAGKTVDLWKYNDFKNGSVIHREIYYGNRFTLAFASENAEKIEHLNEAFAFPEYALTLGSSDSLAKIMSRTMTTEFHDHNALEHCIVQGNIVKEVMQNSRNGLDFSIYSTAEPISYDVPVQFHYEGDYAVRRVIKRQELSFIGRAMKLNVMKRGVWSNDIFVPLFPLEAEHGDKS